MWFYDLYIGLFVVFMNFANGRSSAVDKAPLRVKRSAEVWGHVANYMQNSGVAELIGQDLETCKQSCRDAVVVCLGINHRSAGNKCQILTVAVSSANDLIQMDNGYTYYNRYGSVAPPSTGFKSKHFYRVSDAHKLENSTIATKQMSSKFDCALWCTSEEGCKSFNFENGVLCELNSEDKDLGEAELKAQINSEYWRIKT